MPTLGMRFQDAKDSRAGRSVRKQRHTGDGIASVARPFSVTQVSGRTTPRGDASRAEPDVAEEVGAPARVDRQGIGQVMVCGFLKTPFTRYS